MVRRDEQGIKDQENHEELREKESSLEHKEQETDRDEKATGRSDRCSPRAYCAKNRNCNQQCSVCKVHPGRAAASSQSRHDDERNNTNRNGEL